MTRQSQPIPAGFSLIQAHREGWTLHTLPHPQNGPEGETQLRGLDCGDQQAWWRVASKARLGSRYHLSALALISAAEREQIALRFGPF
ncbi:hypothetical protein AA106555_1817 [Neokomagataea thailandica NBRC 106555]|uniref:Uncharacterized protein n=3 Tax=Neokomagataea TaxID=1223423 RepID=A0A4Y6VCH4_9PROT|nr:MULTISPECIES: hypothetical protein [Neokomagataea]MBR0560489.1 hypothetical protein [Neokomagataea anthophila]QDH26075.1 hypothetical protein D5366_11735 [Neokomagataea tanensis]GBR54769.1 hypothetical protein AA106555_1817 [Neokomagataea thailandica NBRC 106555]